MAEEVKFTGKGKLVERPLDVYYEILDKQNISYRNEENKLPLVVNGNEGRRISALRRYKLSVYNWAYVCASAIRL